MRLAERAGLCAGVEGADNVAGCVRTWLTAWEAHPRDRGRKGGEYEKLFTVCPDCAFGRTEEQWCTWHPFIWRLRDNEYATCNVWAGMEPPTCAEEVRKGARETDGWAELREAYERCTVQGMQDDAFGVFAPGKRLRELEYVSRGAADICPELANRLRYGFPWGFTRQSQPKVQNSDRDGRERKTKTLAIARRRAMWAKAAAQAAERCVTAETVRREMYATMPQSTREREEGMEVQAAELDAWIGRGSWEGPLSAPPKILTDQYTVFQNEVVEDKATGELRWGLKPRVITNCKRAGTNAAAPASTAMYATVSDAIAMMRPSRYMITGDQPKAFTRKPTAWRDADAVVVQHPVTGEYWRARFVVFGQKAGPEFQTMESETSRVLRAKGYGATPTAAATADPEGPLSGVEVEEPCDGKWEWICLMDDYFTTAGDELEALAEYAQMKGLQGHCGPTLADDKFHYGQKLAFAGVELDSVAGVARLGPLKMKKYRDSISALLVKVRADGWATRDEIATVVGRMNFAATWVNLESYLIDCIYVLWPRDEFGPAEKWKHKDSCTQRPGSGRKAGVVGSAPLTKAEMQARWDPDERLVPSEKAMACWEYWVANMARTNGRALHLEKPAPGVWKGQVAQQVADLVKVMERDHEACRTPSEGIAFFSSDASGAMGAGVYGAASFAVKLKQGAARDKDWHIMFPELELACYTPIHFKATMFDEGGDKRVLGLCDNMGDVFAWNKGWSSNSRLSELIRVHKERLRAEGIELVLVYINTKVNPADKFTRGTKPFSEAYRLVGQQWETLLQEYGVDHEAFGDATNNRCRSYGSVHEPFGSVSLEGKTVFLNAPFSKMMRAMDTLRRARRRWQFDTLVLVPTRSAGTARCMPAVLESLRAMGGTVVRTYEEGTYLFEKQCTYYLESELEAGPRIVPTGRLMWDVELWLVPKLTTPSTLSQVGTEPERKSAPSGVTLGRKRGHLHAAKDDGGGGVRLLESAGRGDSHTRAGRRRVDSRHG